MENKAVYILCAGCVAVVGYALYATHKANKVMKKVDLTLDEVAKNVDVDISDNVIQAAVDRTVRTVTIERVKKAVDKAVTDVEKDISKQISEAVKEQYNDIRSDVKKELEKQVSELSVESIRNEVISKAKQAAVEKFQNDLDSVLESYNKDLNNVGKIYSSIAESLANRSTQNNNDGPTFKIV